jgi:hypothetical protein
LFYQLRKRAKVDGPQRCFQPRSKRPSVVGSHVAWSKTARAAIAVFDKSVAAQGVPQRLLAVHHMVGGSYGFRQVLVIVDGDRSPSPTGTARSSSSTPDPHPA